MSTPCKRSCDRLCGPMLCPHFFHCSVSLSKLSLGPLSRVPIRLQCSSILSQSAQPLQCLTFLGCPAPSPLPRARDHSAGGSPDRGYIGHIGDIAGTWAPLTDRSMLWVRCRPDSRSPVPVAIGPRSYPYCMSGPDEVAGQPRYRHGLPRTLPSPGLTGITPSLSPGWYSKCRCLVIAKSPPQSDWEIHRNNKNEKLSFFHRRNILSQCFAFFY